MEVCGEAMWCGVCHVPVNHLDRSSAKCHVKSAGHKKAMVTRPSYVQKPGSSAPICNPPMQPQEKVVPGIRLVMQACVFTQAESSTPMQMKQKMCDLKSLLDGLSQKEAITDDFVAAFFCKLGFH